MKKKHSEARAASPVDRDEILPEYDFSHAIPNKYAARYASPKMASESELQGSVPLDSEAPFMLGFSSSQARQLFIEEMCTLTDSLQDCGTVNRTLHAANHVA
jgi:hypothetical protein